MIAAFHHSARSGSRTPEIDKFDEDVLVLGEDRDAVGMVFDLVGAACRAAAASSPADFATPSRSRA